MHIGESATRQSLYAFHPHFLQHFREGRSTAGIVHVLSSQVLQTLVWKGHRLDSILEYEYQLRAWI